jgi:hypothetical protein
MGWQRDKKMDWLMG